MKHIVLIDPQFAQEPDVERRVIGPEPRLDVVRLGNKKVDGSLFEGADTIVNCRSRHVLTREVVDTFETIELVVQAGVGYDHIDLEACAARGIPVCNTPDYGTMEVADHAMALTLSLLRGVVAYNERLHERDDAWNTLALPLPPIRRMRDQTFGIVGLGRIGMATAQRARAFNMPVMFYDPHIPAGVELALGLQRADTLEALLENADIVSLHCALTPETERMIDDAAVALMKQDAILINTARGRVIDLDAVERGLRSGKLCAAGLDVLPKEPLDRSHPLIAAWAAQEAWLEGRLALTPHAAFYSPESLVDIRALAMQAVVDFYEKGRLRSCVNASQLERHGHGIDR